MYFISGQVQSLKICPSVWKNKKKNVITDTEKYHSKFNCNINYHVKPILKNKEDLKLKSYKFGATEQIKVWDLPVPNDHMICPFFSAK